MSGKVWIVLAFAVGLVVGGFGMKRLDVSRAEAQPAGGAKWDHKFFTFSGATPEDKQVAEINEGGWEYSGFTMGGAASGATAALFKRQKK
jgi:hypothetical protein